MGSVEILEIIMQSQLEDFFIHHVSTSAAYESSDSFDNHQKVDNKPQQKKGVNGLLPFWEVTLLIGATKGMMKKGFQQSRNVILILNCGFNEVLNKVETELQRRLSTNF